jgi:uncharacterized protein
VADGAGAAILLRARLRFQELKFRAVAVMDRVRLWYTLPPAPADGCRRTSQYVTVRDGTRIAIDIHRPTKRGVPLAGPLPVIWSFERYHRARLEKGRLRTRLEGELWLEPFCRRGYVVCVADLRGTGASFGVRRALVMEEDRWDAYDITEWLAAQPWSNGRVGMFGRSFMGMTQYLAASTAPPHLVAIMPEKTLFDLYSFAHTGGVFRDDYARAWGAHVEELDRQRVPVAVDGDADGRLRSEAMADHRENVDIQRLFAALPLRDSAADDGSPTSAHRASPSVRSPAGTTCGRATHCCGTGIFRIPERCSSVRGRIRRTADGSCSRNACAGSTTGSRESTTV